MEQLKDENVKAPAPRAPHDPRRMALAIRVSPAFALLLTRMYLDHRFADTFPPLKLTSLPQALR